MNLAEELRGIDLNDPGGWPPRVRAVSVILVLLAVVILGTRIFVMNAEHALLGAAKHEEVELRGAFELRQRRAANIELHASQKAEIGAYSEALLGRLSGTAEVSGLLAELSRVGLDAGLEEHLFQPGEEVRGAFYAELPVSMRLAGDYHQLGRFVTEIATIPQIVTLHDLHIRPADGGGAEELLMDVTARTYRFPGDDDDPP